MKINQSIMQKHETRYGFTLVELSVVLVIISVLIGTMVSFGSTRIEAQRLASTKQRIKFVTEAIDQYVKRYNHLPCPADPTLEPTDANYGVGQGTNDRGGDAVNLDWGNCTGSTEIDATKRIFRGAVPFIELNISSHAVLDGWGNRMTYIVDEDLTFVGDVWTDDGAQKFGYANMGNEDYYYDATLTTFVGTPDLDDMSSQGDIVIRNDEGVNGVSISTVTAYAVMSHGANGFRAFTDDGIRLPNSTDLNEAENGDDDDTLVQRMPSNSYDDIMIYKAKWQINQ